MSEKEEPVVSSFSSKTLVIVTIAVIIVVALILALTSKSNNKSSNSSQANQTAATAQIKANWQKFFAASTPLSEREKLLQNGSKFAPSMQSEFQALGSQQSSAVINKLTLHDNTSADIIYTIYLNKQAVLVNQKGQALNENNTWVVSDATLCNLLNLGGSKPAVCANVH